MSEMCMTCGKRHPFKPCEAPAPAVRRWFRYQEPDAYDARVILECGFCRDFPDPQAWTPNKPRLMRSLRQDWRFRTTSLQVLIRHYRDKHAPDFVTVKALLDQTGIWNYERSLMHPNMQVLFPQIYEAWYDRRGYLYYGGITS